MELLFRPAEQQYLVMQAIVAKDGAVARRHDGTGRAQSQVEIVSE